MKHSRWFFVFFLLSGFCGLVYEVVWLRLSMAKFGVTTPLVSIVLSVFMGGLGLGAWLGGKWMRRFETAPPAAPLRLYGLLELLIGISAFAAPASIDFGYRLLRDSNSGLAWASGAYYLASAACVALALLPWCTCMGCTFPFAMAAIRRLHGDGAERSFSFLYLANVLGAIAGAIVPAFFLIELFGFYGTLHIASALNGILAAMVFALSFQWNRPAGRPPEVKFRAAGPSGAGLPAGARAEGARWFHVPTVFARRTPEPVVRTPEASAPSRDPAILWYLFATGLCSMAMEVIWIREFTVYLGNVVYAFAAILATYLAATFAGSFLYRRRAARATSASPRGSSAWIALGLASLLPLLFADPRLPIPGEQYTVEGFLFGALRAGLGVIAFSGLAGYLTPMLVDQWSSGDPLRAGRAYAVNVLGSIVGPLVSGFLILPYVSEHWGLAITALPLFAIGLRQALAAKSARPVFAVCAAAAVLLLIFTEDYGAIFPQRRELRDYAATVIATGEGMDKRILVNGTGMTVLTPITKVMAHLPLALLDRPAHNALVICFGMGTTFRSMMSWGLDTTAVELIPSVPKLFGYFHEDGPALLESPRAHMVIDDGRRYLERSAEKFDVIAVDPPPPISAPTSGLLYSRQIYALMKPRLAPGGIAQVWYPGGDAATQSAIARAFREAFPYVRTFQSIQGWGIHFLGRMQPFPNLGGEELAARLPARAAADLVEWQDGEAPGAMMTRVLQGERSIDSLIAPDPTQAAITDEHPVNEYFLLRHLESSHKNDNARTGAPAVHPIGAPVKIDVPLGLPPVPIPPDNPPTAETIALGRRLFYDNRLSVDNTLSCASCHNPELEFTDRLPTARGVRAQMGTRNTPTILNAVYNSLQFWDGRAPTLEDQSGGPIANPIEMSQTHDACVVKLNKDSAYRHDFEAAFGPGPIGITKVEMAVASFERTLISGNSPFDRYQFGGDKTAMSPAAIRGLAIFTDKNRGNCSTCHTIEKTYALFTDGKFHNLGAGMNSDGELTDLGRYTQTHDEKDRGAFRTPSLRNVAKTAPYMHDGSKKTLKEVVDFYVGGGNSNPQLDPEIKELHLTGQDRADLVAFLEALTCEPPPAIARRPVVPPVTSSASGQ